MTVKLVITSHDGTQHTSQPENLNRAITIAEGKMTRHARGIREIRIYASKKLVKRWRAYTTWHETGT